MTDPLARNNILCSAITILSHALLLIIYVHYYHNYVNVHAIKETLAALLCIDSGVKPSIYICM